MWFAVPKVFAPGCNIMTNHLHFAYVYGNVYLQVAPAVCVAVIVFERTDALT